jgi:hypothetical protein
MQFSVSDIRKWGSLKIFNNYFTTDIGRQGFIERLRQLNFALSDYKCSAYSIPRVYKDVYYDMHSQYYGMSRFVDMCEPLLRSIDNPDDSIKRKIRNQWDSLWKCLKEDLSLSEVACKELKELGVRLLFQYKEEDLQIHINAEVFEFYNAILTWYTYTVTESAMANLALSPLELIEFMTINDADKFIYCMQNGF